MTVKNELLNEPEKKKSLRSSKTVDIHEGIINHELVESSSDSEEIVDFLQTQIRRNQEVEDNNENLKIAKNRLKAIRSTIKKIAEQKEKESALSQVRQSQMVMERGTIPKKITHAVQLETGSEMLVIKGLFNDNDVKDGEINVHALTESEHLDESEADSPMK